MQQLKCVLPRVSRFPRYLSQLAHTPQNYQFFWATVQAKMNKSPLEEILQPMIDYRNTHNKPMPSLFYDVLIDLCRTDKEIQSVLSDMLKYQRNCFTIQRLLNIENKKLEKILHLLIDKYGCVSLLQALQSLLQPQCHVLLRILPDYCSEKITFETLYRKFITVSIPSLDILNLLLKLENFDNFAAGFKNKLLSDNGVYTFALSHKCNDFWRKFILEQYISAYQGSNENIGFEDKTWFILNFIEVRSEKQSSRIKLRAKEPNWFDYKVLADLYDACLRKNNVELANYAFSISHQFPLSGHYNDKTRYYANLIHLQSILKIRQNVSNNKNTTKTNINNNTNSILSHNLINDLTSMFFFPSPDLFIANMHYQIANNIDPFDKSVFTHFISIVAINKSTELSENLTKWTEYYANNDSLSINTYCNMLYIILHVSRHLKVPLTVNQVGDVLQRMKPVSTGLEKEKKQFLKALRYFDNHVAVPFEGRPCPIEIHNFILLAYSRMNLFSEMKTKYLSMCAKENQVDMCTYSLLIDTAIEEGIGDQCMFIFEYLWKDILASKNLGNSIPNFIIEGIVECMCICREHGKAIEFINNALKEERSLDLKMFDIYLSSCSLYSDIRALQDLKDILLGNKDERYLEIIDKCSFKVTECEYKQMVP